MRTSSTYTASTNAYWVFLKVKVMYRSGEHAPVQTFLERASGIKFKNSEYLQKNQWGFIRLNMKCLVLVVDSMDVLHNILGIV